MSSKTRGRGRVPSTCHPGAPLFVMCPPSLATGIRARDGDAHDVRGAPSWEPEPARRVAEPAGGAALARAETARGRRGGAGLVRRDCGGHRAQHRHPTGKAAGGGTGQAGGAGLRRVLRPTGVGGAGGERQGPAGPEPRRQAHRDAASGCGRASRRARRPSPPRCSRRPAVATRSAGVAGWCSWTATVIRSPAFAPKPSAAACPRTSRSSSTLSMCSRRGLRRLLALPSRRRRPRRAGSLPSYSRSSASCP